MFNYLLFILSGFSQDQAKNGAAEVVLKHYIKSNNMGEFRNSEDTSEKMEDFTEDENGHVPLPWQHVASFAIYKLFSQWEEDPNLVGVSTNYNFILLFFFDKYFYLNIILFLNKYFYLNIMVLRRFFGRFQLLFISRLKFTKISNVVVLLLSYLILKTRSIVSCRFVGRLLHVSILHICLSFFFSYLICLLHFFLPSFSWSSPVPFFFGFFDFMFF